MAAAPGAWSKTGDMKVDRAQGAGAAPYSYPQFTTTLVPGGKVLAVGGGERFQPLPWMETYDPVTGEWTSAAMEPRCCHSATLLEDGTVLVAGGIGEPISVVAKVMNWLSSAEIYNPISGAWTSTGSMSVPRDGHSANLLRGSSCGAGLAPAFCGGVLVAGGQTSFFVATSSVEVYDPQVGVWTTAPNMLWPRVQHTATTLPDARVVVAGGGSETEAEIFDPTLGLWRSAGTLATPTFNHTATLLENGKVLIAGGSGGPDGGGTVTARTELYDPVSNTWRSCSNAAATAQCPGPLNEPRVLHSASLLRDGRVLVAGGRGSSSAEIYDPATGRWTQTASRAGSGGFFPATTLGCGQVLVAGGKYTDAGAEKTTRSELFTIPGTVPDLSSRALSAREAELRFCAPSAPGASGVDPSPARRFVIKQSTTPITTIEEFDAARPLCGGGPCSFDSPRVGAPLTVSITDLEPATTYYYAIQAVGDQGQQGPVSETAWVTTLTDTVAPGAAALTATTVSARQVDLSFDAVGSDGSAAAPVDDYVIKQSGSPITDEAGFDAATSVCEGACNFGPISVGDQLTFSVKGLKPNKTYHFAVRARDEGGNIGPISNDAHATTLSVTPGAITGLAATALSGEEVELSFPAVGTDGSEPPPAEGYVIKQSASPITDEQSFDAAASLCGGPCAFSPSAVGDGLKFSITGLEPETTYHFAVRARDDSGSLGPVSNDAKVTTLSVAPGRVTDLTASEISGTEIVLHFSAVGSNEMGPPPAGKYSIKQSLAPIIDERDFAGAQSLCRSACTFSPKGVGDLISFNVTDLTPETTYFYAVQVLDPAGNASLMSNVASATTGFVTPGGLVDLKARALSRSRIRLTFSAPGSNGSHPPPVGRYVVKQSRSPIVDAQTWDKSRALCGGVCVLSPNKVGDRIRLIVTSLTPGKRYHYAVRPYDDAGNAGPMSDSVATRARGRASPDTHKRRSRES